MHGALCFHFVSWNTTPPPHSQRRIDLVSDASVKQAVLKSDLSSRVLFYVNMVLVAELAVGGYAHTIPAQNIRIGSHSLAFGITFHFLYILFGYSIRGGRAPHVPFLKFAALTAGGLALVSISAACAGIVHGLSASLILVLIVQAGVCTWHSTNCWQSSIELRHLIHFFKSKSHNWV